MKLSVVAAMKIELEGVFDADQPQALLDFLALDRNLRFERSPHAVVIHKHDGEVIGASGTD